MSDSFAGITVPEGEPDGLRAAAGRFDGLADSLAGVNGRLRGLPAGMTSWQGPASVLYADSCMTQAAGADHAVAALHEAAHSARAFARDLDEAQRDARQAIRDARDAQDRIDAARRAIEAAQADQASASARAEHAAHVLAVSSAGGVPSPGAQAELDAASSAGAEAAAREAAARRELERAQEDLERAQRRGERAEERARAAADAAAAAFAPTGALPGGMPVGAPASGGSGGGSWWNTTNEGARWFDEDEFAASLWPFHAENDAFKTSKWFVEQGLGFGANYVDEAAFAAAAAAQARATTPWLRTTTTRSTFLYGVNGRPVLWGSITQTSQRLVPPPPGVVSQSLAAHSRMSRIGWAARGGGVALAGVSGFLEQWHEDSANPNLTTTDRVGRAAGVGTYMTLAAGIGAGIGSIVPGAGTLAGAAIGAGIGLAVGAVANSIDPAKEAFADAGQWTANAVVDGVEGIQSGLDAADRFIDETGDRIAEGVTNVAEEAGDRIAEGVSNAVEDVTEHLPDVDIDLPGPF